MKDLLPVVRSSVYHPQFDFGSSIKTAAPALCPEVRYDDLEITEGGAASTAFWRMATGQVDATAVNAVRASLQRYCERDTWALLRLHQALSRKAILSSRRVT
jgi:hypothetical protein